MESYQAQFYPFDERPLADSCWSLHAGPDGRIYAASCIEHHGGESATVVRYDSAGDRLDYLFDMDTVTGDLRDSGRATQCKIHYSFAPDPATGLLYAATHLSGPPKGERYYNAWTGWHDPQRAFRGAYLVAYDTRAEAVAWTSLLIPREGCRCVCLDPRRRRLYALSYPRDHLVRFDLERRRLTDLGRIGSVNCQCLFSDRGGRIYFTSDMGVFQRYDPDADRIETLPLKIPHAWYQTGWHGVLYDVVADPELPCVYMVPWMAEPHLMRYWFEEGPHGRIEDLGPATHGAYDRSLPPSMSLEHAGGLVFGRDRHLYYVAARWTPEAEKLDHFLGNRDSKGVLVRLNPRTLEREEVALLEREGTSSHYASRGAIDAEGHLYFGNVGRPPVGIFRVTVPAERRPADVEPALRLWG